MKVINVVSRFPNSICLIIVICFSCRQGENTHSTNDKILHIDNVVDLTHIGVDVLSFDPGIDASYSGHKILFAKGKWGVECVANLNKIPKIGATIIVGAPKVGGATGGFSRIIAVW